MSSFDFWKYIYVLYNYFQLIANTMDTKTILKMINDVALCIISYLNDLSNSRIYINLNDASLAYDYVERSD